MKYTEQRKVYNRGGGDLINDGPITGERGLITGNDYVIMTTEKKRKKSMISESIFDRNGRAGI